MKKELRILLADDHTSVRYGLRAILETQPGWKVVAEASDGEEALLLAEEHEPDVVVLDLYMPRLGGVEVARRLRKAKSKVHILILTMHSSEQSVSDALEAGADGYILKTDSPRLIQAAVEAVAEERPFFNSAVAAAAAEAVAGAPSVSPRTHGPMLTPRQREVVRLLAEGMTNKDVAQRLGLSVKTADVHRTNIMHRLNIHTVAELVRYAVRERIIEP